METTITDSQKIQTILDELSISSYRLTQELNLSCFKRKKPTKQEHNR